MRLTSWQLTDLSRKSVVDLPGKRDVVIKDRDALMELANLQKLERLSINDNMLSGTMPAQICGLTENNGPLGYLVADCDQNEIECGCCTQCF